LEGDIAACFDEINHSALLDRVRLRISDRRVVALIKAFLKAGIFNTETGLRDSPAGTPQGGSLSPLLANLAPAVTSADNERPLRHDKSPTNRQGSRRCWRQRL
jgi:RNA-directed DNA polymerase